MEIADLKSPAVQSLRDADLKKIVTDGKAKMWSPCRGRARGSRSSSKGVMCAGAAASTKMDFTHADRAPTDKLNLILWQDARGAQPPPAMLLEKHSKHKDDDDD